MRVGLLIVALVATGCASVARIDDPASGKTANGCPARVPLTDAIVQQALGLTEWEYAQMRDLRGLTREEFCTMPRDKLARAKAKATEPASDHPEEWAEFRRLQQSDENGNLAPDAYYRASQQRALLVDRFRPDVAGITPASWTALGPGNIGGRVRAISPNPADPSGNDILIGGVAGGVWRTLDGGATWHPVNDFMGNLAIATIVRDPGDPQAVYAGTGEGFFNQDAVRGYGIFKSTDGGATWALIPGTTPSTLTSDIKYGFFNVNRIAVHPTNPLMLLAATTGAFCNTGGLLRSTDGGATWTMVYNRRALDVKFDPSNANRVVVAEGVHCVDDANNFTNTSPSAPSPFHYNGGGVAVSTDGGATFTYPTARTKLMGATNPPFPQGRVELAWGPATPGLVVAQLDWNGGAGSFGRLYVSTDGGATWAYNSTPGDLGSQGWYDNAIWVDPTDSRRVLVAGLDIYASSLTANWWVANIPLTWTKVSTWFTAGSVHADHHAIVHHPGYDGATNRTVFFGNDGGMYKAADVSVVNSGSPPNGWTNLNNGLAITQFYGGAGQTSAGYRLVGGTQDNGSLRATATVPTDPWASYFGGDGGFAAVSPTDANTFYGEYVYAAVHRTTNGASGSYICYGSPPGTNNIADGYSGIPPNGCGGSNAANFISPFILDPNNADTMLVGGTSLWRSTNVRTSAPAQPTWSAIKAPAGAGNYISAIAVAPGNSDLVWVGHNNGAIYCTVNGTNASPTWTLLAAGLPARYVMRFMIDPANSNRVFVTFGGYTSPNVYELTDAIQVCKAAPTATARHNNLPMAPVRSIVRHPTNPNWLYVGTEVGIFASTDGGMTWSTTNDGPGNISVDELFWLNSTTLVAATHGRGMFKSVLTPGLRVVIPDGTSLKQTFSGFPETRWFAMTVEPGKTYAVETVDGDDDLNNNAIFSLNLYAVDTVSAPAEANVDCTAANGPRPPAVDVMSDGIRCVLRTAPPGPGMLQNQRPVYIAVTRMDPALGGGTQFRVRAREATVYGRWVTAGFDYHVELENTTGDALCVELTRYPASGLAYLPGPGWSGTVKSVEVTVPAFGAATKVFFSGDMVGADSDGPLRMGACASSTNLLPAGLHASTYAFDPVLSRYVYYFTSTANDGRTRDTR